MLAPQDAKVAIIVYDGMGSIAKCDDEQEMDERCETISFFLGKDGIIEPVGQTFGRSLPEHTDFPRGATNSIGMFYEMVTAALGFDLYDPGKTMGLAAHGEPRFVDVLGRGMTFNNSRNCCFEYDALNAELPRTLERLLAEEGFNFCVKADIAARARTA